MLMNINIEIMVNGREGRDAKRFGASMYLYD
jgi:hypothetical protein